MRKLRILLFEVIGLAVLIGWLMWKYPELVDSIIPWIALGVCWHITWEFILDTQSVKQVGTVLKRRIKLMIAWPLVFLIGGGISLLYWKGINSSLVELSTYAEKKKRSSTIITPNPPSAAPTADSPQPTVPPLQTSPAPTPLKTNIPVASPELEVRYSNDSPYTFLRGTYKYFRFGLFNKSAILVENVHVNLINVEPRPQDNQFGADFPYPIYPENFSPLSNVSINPQDEVFFEMATSWFSSDGRVIISGLNKRQPGESYPIEIGKDEVWKLTVKATSANAKPLEFSFQMNPQGNALEVKRLKN